MWLQAGYVCFILFLSHSAGCILLIKGIAPKIEEIGNRGKFKPTIKISSGNYHWINILYYYIIIIIIIIIIINEYATNIWYVIMIFWLLLVYIGYYWFVVYCPMDYTRHDHLRSSPGSLDGVTWAAPGCGETENDLGMVGDGKSQDFYKLRWVFRLVFIFRMFFQMTFDLEIFRSGNAWRARRFEQPTTWTFLM